eukprot:Gb_32098 [translate_table: standard]
MPEEVRPNHITGICMVTPLESVQEILHKASFSSQCLRQAHLDSDHLDEVPQRDQ